MSTGYTPGGAREREKCAQKDSPMPSEAKAVLSISEDVRAGRRLVHGDSPTPFKSLFLESISEMRRSRKGEIPAGGGSGPRSGGKGPRPALGGTGRGLFDRVTGPQTPPYRRVRKRGGPGPPGWSPAGWSTQRGAARRCSRRGPGARSGRLGRRWRRRPQWSPARWDRWCCGSG